MVMLGQRINELRLAFGWNQVEMSKKLGVSKQTVSNWENDNIQPSIEALMRLADLFGVSTDYLLGRDDKRTMDVDGLPSVFIAHLTQIIDDYRNK